MEIWLKNIIEKKEKTFLIKIKFVWEIITHRQCILITLTRQKNVSVKDAGYIQYSIGIQALEYNEHCKNIENIKL